MDKETLKQYLGNRYQGSASFLHNVILPIFGEDNFEDGYDTELLDIYPERRRLAQATGIKSVRQVGSFYIGVEPLLIFDITVADRIMMERNRVGIQRLVHAVMDQYSCAFMLFHYDHDERWDWRFTFCHRGDRASDFTDSHRYTFLLGPGQSCRTAADNFYNLYQNRAALEVKDIEQAFSIEALSKEFFGKYKAQYERFVAYVTGKAYVKSGGKYVERVVNPHNDKAMYAAFGHDDRRVRDYVKRLLGRIVFLHFLQKKGWLGLPEGAAWDSGLGNPDFMHELYLEASSEQQSDFLDQVLEPLFTAIDTDRSGQGDLYDTGVLGRVRVPYLNGGLFERDSDDEITSRFPKDYFAGLLQFFSEYNFTVDENDPNDAQVGIDPEMLSRIFENLLEDNKDKGAYYTPKEVVRHICRESLIAYLQTGYDETHRQAIRRFVLTHEPEPIADIRDDINRRLREVKICDPAIGSGAFPMGMLKEIFQCRYALEEFSNAAQIKREIIQSNIYGVDIEQGAVEIARLRFWLSLVVDERTPATLPNLDFKIMQGNSLLEQYKGVDLSTITALKRETHHDAGIQTTIFDSDVDVLRKRLTDKLSAYFNCTDHTQKAHMRKDIADIVQQEIYAQSYNVSLSGIDIHANDQFFLWHTWFNDVFSRPSKQGFDIVIGNPPYGASYPQEQKAYFKKFFVTAQTNTGVQKGSLDTFTLFIEQGYNLLCRNGVFAYIVPISITSSDAMTGVHRLIMDHCNPIYISSFAVRPKPVFENAVVNTSILMMRKTETRCRHLYATKMYRRDEGQFSLANLMEHLQFTDVLGYTLYGRIPKISLEIEKRILDKLKANGLPISYYLVDRGIPIIYRFAGGRYFKVVTNYAIGSSAERKIYFRDKNTADSIGCILSSNLSFWFYQIYSDNLNWKNYEIENFRVPHLTSEQKTTLARLYGRYLQDIEEKANVRQTTGRSSYNVASFKEYKIVRSKPIIDEIDDYIGPLYGLTQEEIDFVKNYELRFRMSGE